LYIEQAEEEAAIQGDRDAWQEYPVFYLDFNMWSDIIKVQCQNCRKREEERQ